MNKYIKEQLEKLNFINMPEYNDSSTVIVIPKSESTLFFKVGSCYLIKMKNVMEDSLWNSGKINSRYLKVIVNEILGSNITVDATGYDFENKRDKNDVYMSVTLNIKDVEIICRLA